MRRLAPLLSFVVDGCFNVMFDCSFVGGLLAMFAGSVLAGKRALLLWVKNQVKDQELPVENFSTSFCDGRVLAGLVDALVPGELNLRKVCVCVCVCVLLLF